MDFLLKISLLYAKEDFTLSKSPLSFNLNFRSLVTHMGSQSDSVGIQVIRLESKF